MDNSFEVCMELLRTPLSAWHYNPYWWTFEHRGYRLARVKGDLVFTNGQSSVSLRKLSSRKRVLDFLSGVLEMARNHSYDLAELGMAIWSLIELEERTQPTGMLKRIFLTADLHLSHKRIIEYVPRPFANSKEMDETILKNWNRVVPENGEVYILGDVTFGSPGYTDSLLSGMKGKKYLIRGNHDKTSRIKKIEHCFEWVKDYHELIVQEHDKKHMIVLSHYAFRVWNKSHHGSYHAFGHSHGTLKVPETSLSMDVGVDCHNFHPVSLVKFIEEMERRKKLWVT